MTEYCLGCKKRHDDTRWKSWYNKDTKKVEYICKLYFKPTSYEIVPQRIKDEREKYGADQVQSHRQGEFSREFAEIYPERTREMIKAGVVTQDEVRNSRPVWKGDIKHLDKAKKAEADLI